VPGLAASSGWPILNVFMATLLFGDGKLTSPDERGIGSSTPRLQGPLWGEAPGIPAAQRK
jgi:hypothetical protein